MVRKYVVPLLLGTLTVVLLLALVGAAYCRAWIVATAWATLLAGLIAADVVVWQVYLVKRQLAFSTYLDLDKEWNSEEMLEVRRTVHPPDSEQWDYSRLEAILEFFEKLASMFKLSGEMPFVYQSTLGWYAAHYFLFAREHHQIQHLREMWRDQLYDELENFYKFYVVGEAGSHPEAQRKWELDRLRIEARFWKQERKD